MSRQNKDPCAFTRFSHAANRVIRLSAIRARTTRNRLKVSKSRDARHVSRVNDKFMLINEICKTVLRGILERKRQEAKA